MKKIALLALVVLPALVLADSAAPGPVQSFLDKAIAYISSLSSSSLAVSAAALLELLLRLVKTDKPQSIAWLISSGIKKASELLGAIAALLDKLLPQNTK